MKVLLVFLLFLQSARGFRFLGWEIFKPQDFQFASPPPTTTITPSIRTKSPEKKGFFPFFHSYSTKFPSNSSISSMAASIPTPYPSSINMISPSNSPLTLVKAFNQTEFNSNLTIPNIPPCQSRHYDFNSSLSRLQFRMDSEMKGDVDFHHGMLRVKLNPWGGNIFSHNSNYWFGKE